MIEDHETLASKREMREAHERVMIVPKGQTMMLASEQL